MDIQRETALKYQGLFDLMAKEHGLILEQSEMDEIIREAMAVVKLFNAPAVVGRSEQLICPECENQYPHSHTDGSYSCEDCGHKWGN